MISEGQYQEQIKAIISLFSNKKFHDALVLTDNLSKQYPAESLLFNIRGACHAGMGKLDFAVKDYEMAIAIDSDNYKAYYNLGGTLQDLGRLDEAVLSFEKSLFLKPDYEEAHNNLGNVFSELNQFDNAINSYENAIRIKPNYLEAHYSLGRAFQHLGQINEAINCYKRVLVINPEFVEMHNNLGVLFNETGQLDDSLKHLKLAIEISPKFTEAHNNLGNVLKALGRTEESLKSYQTAVKINSNYAEANYNLGTSWQENKQFDKAINQYEKVILINPNYVEAHNNLGVIYLELQQINKAIKCFENTLLIDPNFIEAHYNLGNAFKEFNQPDNAVKSFKKAIAIKSDYVEAHNNLGITLKDLNKFDDAINCYQKALTFNPEYAEAYNNLGNVLKLIGRPYEAIINFHKTLDLKPDYAEAHNNLAITFMQLGQLEDAQNSFKKALDLKPDYAEAHCNYGILLNRLGQLDDSLKCYEKALLKNPNYAKAFAYRGDALIDLRRFDDALDSYNLAFSLDPNIDFNLGNLLHTKMHLCIWDNLSSQLLKLTKKINNYEKAVDPFSFLALEDDPKLHKKIAETFSNYLYPKNYELPKISNYTKHSKIRIGYFSADFRDHPVGSLTAELYEIHNRKDFEVFAFSFCNDTNDELNLRIKSGVDHFYDVQSISHKEVVMLSRSLEIDIAIDLGGFTQDCRPGIFAMKAAPIQVNYLGYPGTMGASYMDYIIADKTLIPENYRHYYSEKIVYLPDSFMVNDTKNKFSTKLFTREEVSLPKNGFVFCCFNNHYKITPNAFTSWMRILSQVEGSVLWLPDGKRTAVNNLKKEAEKNGIDSSRLIFAPRLDSREDHLNRIQLADLFLDTYPYNAHATTSDALQVGLPIITLIGKSFASRVAASLINSVDLPELITTTQEEYEILAIDIATNPEKMKIIKDKLNNNLISSPLYDSISFTLQLESAYRIMSQRHEKKLEFDHIYV